MHPQPPFHSHTLNYHRIRNKIGKGRNNNPHQPSQYPNPPKSAPLPRKTYENHAYNNNNSSNNNDFVCLSRENLPASSAASTADVRYLNTWQSHPVPSRKISNSTWSLSNSSNGLNGQFHQPQQSFLHESSEYSELRAIVKRIEQQQRRAQRLQEERQLRQNGQLDVGDVEDDDDDDGGFRQHHHPHPHRPPAKSPHIVRKRSFYFDYVPQSVLQKR